MGFSRQEYWSGLSCPPPEDLPYPGTEPETLECPAFQADFFFFNRHHRSPVLLMLVPRSGVTDLQLHREYATPECPAFQADFFFFYR